MNKVISMGGTALARFIVGATFLLSGSVKLEDLEGFAAITTSYSLVPRRFSAVVEKVAYVIPFTEVLAGSLLVIQEFTVPALYYVVGSVILYGALESVELLRGRDMANCGCYGTTFETELSWGQVAKNSVLLLLAVWLLMAL